MDWIKRHKFLTGAVGVIGLIALASLSQAGSTAQAPAPAPVYQANVEQTVATQPTYQQPVTQTAAPSQDAPDNSYTSRGTYTNVDGNEIQRPVYTNDNSVPAGASARCGDGSYSFSAHRQGTCSHHGGVSEWL